MSLDWTILYFIQNHLTNPGMDWLMPKITMLGDFGAIWIIIAILLISIKKYRVHGLTLLLALAIGILIGNLGLKNIIARPRPCWIDHNIQMLIPMPKDFSFPSGHTLAAVIAATCLYMTNKWFGIFVIILASLIAFSRLYLFVHFPSDVLASIILGLIIAVLAIHYMLPIVDNCLSKISLSHKQK